MTALSIRKLWTIYKRTATPKAWAQVGSTWRPRSSLFLQRCSWRAESARPHAGRRDTDAALRTTR